MQSPSNMVSSPVTNGAVRLVNSFNIKTLIDLYRSRLDFDVAPHLPEGLRTIDVFECLDTGYRFHYPFDLEGKPRFYEELYSREGDNWSYTEGKWEHTYALGMCKGGTHVLDVGAGNGTFLRMARTVCPNVTGLETSSFGIREGERQGLALRAETIQQHAVDHAATYDRVTSFQVMEHVSDVADFLAGILRVCKPGGKIILSVPNNDSFVGFQHDLPLNLPPHHVGLWNQASLEKLENFFPLRVQKIVTEPLPPNHQDWYRSWLENRYLPRNRLMKAIYYRTSLHKIVERFVAEQAHTIQGHTILAVFERC